jgi:transcriptional regulator with XRE-family HTH domain
VRYAPLFIHSFVLCAPRRILEAAQFNQRYRRYEEIQNVPDRLRWLRHSKGLIQVEVADKVGMTHSVYKAIEEGFTQYIDLEKVEGLALFYGVPVTDFLDEFNRFLYDGQVNRIRAYRESMGLGKKPFARELGISIRSLQEWESGRKTISHKSWERYFKGRV